MQRERKPKNFLPKPIYKGGPKAMSAFIADHLKYPKEAVEHKIEGTVVIRITIDYKGQVIGTQVKSSLGYGCDQEAQRIVNLLVFQLQSKVRKGKILFHKTINIRFRLPKAKTKTTESLNKEVRLSYNIISTEKAKQASYNYTITIGS